MAIQSVTAPFTERKSVYNSTQQPLSQCYISKLTFQLYLASYTIPLICRASQTTHSLCNDEFFYTHKRNSPSQLLPIYLASSERQGQRHPRLCVLKHRLLYAILCNWVKQAGSTNLDSCYLHNNHLRALLPRRCPRAARSEVTFLSPASRID